MGKRTLAIVPVLALLVAACGGQYESNQVCFSLGKHMTTDNLRRTRAFTLSFADARTVVQSDYFGMVSGNRVVTNLNCKKKHAFRACFFCGK